MSVPSSELGPLPPPPPQASVAPPGPKWGEDTLAFGKRGGGDPIPEKGTDTVVLYMYIIILDRFSIRQTVYRVLYTDTHKDRPSRSQQKIYVTPS